MYCLNADPSQGVAVTAGTNNWGGYFTLVSGANLTFDAYMVRLYIYSTFSAGYAVEVTYCIGTDPAGGTSYSQYTGQGINFLSAPQASYPYMHPWYIDLPIFIKAGTSVGIRAANSYNTAGGYVKAIFFGRPDNPAAAPTAHHTEYVGMSALWATAVVCGVSGAKGSWTSLGTTTRATWAWLLCAGYVSNTLQPTYNLFDLAWYDGTNYNIIVYDQPVFVASANEQVGGRRIPAYANVPSGVTMYARGSTDYTSAGTTKCMAIGFGG